ncbi:MAG: Protein translocase subunit SecE [Methanocorpusculum sp. MCE]|nr:MAG: Protein translocase subunit SecE [Methanocorpusculum sp. MCE]
MAKNEKNTDEKKALPSIQIKKPEITKASVSEFFRKYIRVLKLARIPTKEEFWKISAVAAVGIVLIGVLGFLIYLIFEYLLP